jgi:hypothetical protein
VFQQEIQLRLKAKAAEDDLRGKPSVSGRQRSRFGKQFIARVATLFNATEDIEGNAASGRDVRGRQASSNA